jgi:hypothetical protein
VRAIPTHTCQHFCCPVCHYDKRTHRSECIDTVTAPKPDAGDGCQLHTKAGTFCVRPCRTCDRAIARRVGDLAYDLVDERIRASHDRSRRIPAAA